MGYIDLLRGKYPDSGNEKFKVLKIYLEEMTCEERMRLSKESFYDMWFGLWSNHSSKLYINEYENAEKRFMKLDIKDLLSKTTCRWTEQEYGFPKGRKNMYESNIDCAKREFREETGYNHHDVKIITDNPREELFVGTNGIQYRHIYYIAEISGKNVLPRDKIEIIRDGGEIFNVGWFTFDQCLKVIRPYDTAKKRLLEGIHEKFKDRYD
ncbi:hypothetical protein BJ085DRAFT_28179 [Dimargaris cristalligena]|uniref:Nudix hydrolase domain-containing protein n=1 Tax=Dimargaris cristalligena TaxID=215637 RepID=A0A4V1J4F4_9FUNG|nr:hypothetical protein BJ085DRAFT_28179 [Dimargaris cristalligena]|eukprot:RKP35369.1 hypothetical protein BJ085DRAFT_28179 [Dimargaris cristalligena]